MRRKDDRRAGDDRFGFRSLAATLDTSWDPTPAGARGLRRAQLQDPRPESGSTPVVQSALTENPTVTEIVVAVLGRDESDPGERRAVHSLTESISSAAESFSDRGAVAMGRTLFAHLGEEGRSLPEFEALIVLALAKPRLAAKLRFSLSQEGRRLAVLMEHAGDRNRALHLLEVLNSRLPEDRHVERDLAAMLRKTGNVQKLVDRYLRRAEGAVGDGAPMDAIPWLQEVLLVDRSRRDVARMIRDLRYQEAERIERRRRLLKRALVTLALTAVLGFAGWREWELRERFLAIPVADETRIDSINGRIARVDALVASSPLWLGALMASRERTRLKGEIASQMRKLAERKQLALEQAE